MLLNYCYGIITIFSITRLSYLYAKNITNTIFNTYSFALYDIIVPNMVLIPFHSLCWTIVKVKKTLSRTANTT